MDPQKRRKANRLPGYDYSLEQSYFVTGCVQDRMCCFGSITEGVMHLNDFGQIAYNQLLWLPAQYPYVVLEHFIVMPNHMHAIIEINLSALKNKESELKIKSLSSLMGAYKTTSSKMIRFIGLPEFSWQRSFHDHIIRDKTEYTNIARYIQNNAANWGKDKFFRLKGNGGLAT